MSVSGGRFKYSRGDGVIGPRYTRYTPVGSVSDLNDESMGWAPRTRCEFFEDFSGPQRTYSITIPIVEEDGQTTHIDTETGDVSRAVVRVPRAGTLLSVRVLGEDELAAHDTNYVTFALTNKGGAATAGGSTAMLAATDLNTTKSTGGGGAIDDFAGFACTVSGTAANLRVCAGDVLYFTATVSGTLANEVHASAVVLTFIALPETMTARTTKTVGLIGVESVADTACGEAKLSFVTTSEAQVVGLDWADQNLIPASARPVFQCRAKFSGVVAGNRWVMGLADTYAATLDDVVNNCWFRVEGNSLNLLAEIDDSTTDDDDNDTGFDLVADTYYLFTIDATDTGAIRFSVDDTCYLELAASAFAAADVLQPVIWFQNDAGGASTDKTMTIDFIRCSWDRIA